MTKQASQAIGPLTRAARNGTIPRDAAGRIISTKRHGNKPGLAAWLASNERAS